MRWRYLKITDSTLIWGTNDLKASDLVSLKRGGYEAIIDLETMASFDPEANEWKEIEGDA